MSSMSDDYDQDMMLRDYGSSAPPPGPMMSSLDDSAASHSGDTQNEWKMAPEKHYDVMKCRDNKKKLDFVPERSTSGNVYLRQLLT
ncbi:hypothetical protein GX51_00463 [Blastomyces parvus]|uniref:Uncharacterized protein n=1 Tax=Blastomyces parvus TaxID=2060905 RepID=A0A2B7XLF6_9EURO|nr:hypothetical protein GX51_00463 [Blastomyces parvus]